MVFSRKIVVLGMMTRVPVGGVVWQTLQYLLGFDRLGYQAYYVEAHARTPRWLMRNDDDDSGLLAANFLQNILGQFDFGHRWAYQALDRDGHCYGLSQGELTKLYQSADLIINLHGGTVPRSEHQTGGPLVYLETDPVGIEVAVKNGDASAIERLQAHDAFFTFGENLGSPDCGVPMPSDFRFHATRQPIVLDLWSTEGEGRGQNFTTVANWLQTRRTVGLDGKSYTWSKHHEFLKFIGLPSRTPQTFELALTNLPLEHRQTLERHRWRVRNADDFTRDIFAYRSYISTSLAEFTVAKDQNIRLRSGWFSDRSASYLAAGKPVVTQDTAFKNILPVGHGLFSFSTIEEVLEAINRIRRDPTHHSRAALSIAQEFFDYRRVLGDFLRELDLPSRARRERPPATCDAAVDTGVFAPDPVLDNPQSPLPPDLVLTAVSRNPLTLAPTTNRFLLGRAVPAVPLASANSTSDASLVIVTYENCLLTRLCLESVLAHTAPGSYELIVIDNASSDGTRPYLKKLASRNPELRLVLSDSNMGFAPATNVGIRMARGRAIILLNNDTVLAPHWLDRLLWHLGSSDIGMVGPVTNHAGNEARIDVDYSTLGEFVTFSEHRYRERRHERFEIPVLTMFCAAVRRDVLSHVGELDERFEVGMFEDDDYSMRVRQAGYRVVCAEDVFVHHYGGAAFTVLPSDDRALIFQSNRQRFDRKWGTSWAPHLRRTSGKYRTLQAEVRDVVERAVPSNATLIVISKGDPDLLDVGEREAWHFPRSDQGEYAGHNPSTGSEAVNHLEELRRMGGDFLIVPQTAFWWFDAYPEFGHHLRRRYREVSRDSACVIYALSHSA